MKKAEIDFSTSAIMFSRVPYRYLPNFTTCNVICGAHFINLLLEEIKMKTPLGTKIKTGEKCPESGVWKALSTPSTTIPLAKNNVAPPYANMAVTWSLQQYA